MLCVKSPPGRVWTCRELRHKCSVLTIIINFLCRTGPHMNINQKQMVLMRTHTPYQTKKNVLQCKRPARGNLPRHSQLNRVFTQPRVQHAHLEGPQESAGPQSLQLGLGERSWGCSEVSRPVSHHQRQVKFDPHHWHAF